MRTTIILLVVLWLTNPSTFGQDYAQIIHIVIDKTGSYSHEQTPSAYQVIHKFIDNSQSLEVSISEINDVSINEVSTFQISGQSFWETSVNRQDVLDEFYQQTDQKLTEIFSKENGKVESSIYLWMCHIFEEIQNTSATNKTVILFSDLIEHSRLTCSMYSFFKENPDPNSCYDQISSQLTTVQKFPDIRGINIVVVFKPDLETEKIFFLTRRFWKRFFETNGATVKFVANLN